MRMIKMKSTINKSAFVDEKYFTKNFVYPSK